MGSFGPAWAPAFLVLAAAAPAWSADKPRIAPPEPWVLAPIETPAAAKPAQGAAVALLVQDIQLRFDATGWSQFIEYQAKVQSAQGLAALGTLSIGWAPATDTVTVHRLRILRDGKVIDCLPKDGAFTILRRETQLESAALVTGVLTAIVQPEGLRVGDVVDLAITTRREDPLLRGRVDGAVAGFDGAPLSRLRVRALWPKGAAVRWRASDGMADPKLSDHAGEVEALVEGQDLAPLPKPEGAPARFRQGRALAFSDYAAWADVSALMAPLFAQAQRLAPDSPVAAEARAIAARTSDPLSRTSAALALVQEKVRYLAQAIGDGGLRPASADDTWAWRYGDCKAKTALLLALLDALGVKAEPVLASSTLGDGLDGRLPALSAFDHVLVRATIGGRDYWLDGTRLGDASLASISTPNFGYVLPVRPKGAALIRLQPEPAKTPLSTTAVRIDARAGIDRPAPFHVDAIARGDGALGLKLTLANLAPDDLDRTLKAYWRGQYDFVDVAKVSAVYDEAAGEERLAMDGSAKLDWSNGGYEADGDGVGWRFDAHRDPGPHADAPFAVGFPAYEVKTETILLPGAGKGFSTWGEDVDRTLAGYAFRRRAWIEGGAFRLETSSRALKPEITLAEAQAAAGPLTELSKTAVRVRPPAGAAQTAQAATDHKARLDAQPTTRSGYIDRGSALLDDGRYADALKDFDKAVDLDPGSAEAFACRGLAHAWLGQSAAAKADLDRAEALDPSQVVIWRARGLLAERSDQPNEAVAAYSHALEIEPTDLFARFHRADANIRLKQDARVLTEADAMLKADPTDRAAHALRAEVYALRKDFVALRKEEPLMIEPSASEAERRAQVMENLFLAGDKEGVRPLVDQTLAAKPDAHAYMLRAWTRDADDRAGIYVDLKAAIDLDPKAYDANVSLARRLVTDGHPAEALLYLKKAAEAAPDGPEAAVTLAELQARAGDKAAAALAFAKVRVGAGSNANLLNSLCYAQATAGMQLDQALADCEASLKLKPGDPNITDSRGFVLLRLGRDPEAIAAFDAALAARPDLAPSLYGRSLAERRRGSAAAADRDRAAALAKDPKIAETFARYGVER